MVRQNDDETLQLAIPKGRMYEGIVRLLAEAGIDLRQTVRNYRPHVNLPSCEVKILKPQSIVEMLHAGSRDVGFAGADWVAERDGEIGERGHTRLPPRRWRQTASCHPGRWSWPRSTSD
jgi:ATP phosphoribosyltransferase